LKKHEKTTLRTAAEGLDKGRGQTWSVAAWLAAWNFLSGI
jgi:hypothetical protein